MVDSMVDSTDSCWVVQMAEQTAETTAEPMAGLKEAPMADLMVGLTAGLMADCSAGRSALPMADYSADPTDDCSAVRTAAVRAVPKALTLMAGWTAARWAEMMAERKAADWAE